MFRHYFSKRRNRQLRDSCPSGCQFAEKPDAWHRPAFCEFHFADANPAYVKFVNVFCDPSEGGDYRVFDYEYTVDEGDGPINERRTAFLARNSCRTPLEFKVDYLGVLNSLIPDSIKGLELGRGYRLEHTKGQPLPDDLPDQIKAALEQYPDRANIQVRPDAVLITFHNHRWLGKGRPSSLLAWPVRFISIFFGPVKYEADVDSFWELHRFGVTFCELLGKHTTMPD